MQGGLYFPVRPGDEILSTYALLDPIETKDRFQSQTVDGQLLRRGFARRKVFLITEVAQSMLIPNLTLLQPRPSSMKHFHSSLEFPVNTEQEEKISRGIGTLAETVVELQSRRTVIPWQRPYRLRLW